MNNTEIKNWHEIARKEQLIPKDWKWLWLILAGRGFGKTRTGAETIMEMINSGKYKHIAIIGRTITEARDVMVEGMSGMLSTTIAQKMYKNKENKIEDPDILKFKFYRSRNIIVWENGARAYLLSGKDYQKLRGYQFDLVWLDEFAKYKFPEKLWEQVLFTLRIGDDPKCIITTTPKPLRILKRLTELNDVHITQGSTFDNKENLSERFLQIMQDYYKDTWIGKQELEGMLLLEKQNTVWKRENIVYKNIEREALSRVVIGVDPAVSSNEESDETGIIVAGLGYDNKIYVLDDLSGKYSPTQWAKIVCRASHDYHAGKIIAETNNGGDFVEEVLRSVEENVPFKQTRALKGKISRAEPVSMLYEASRVYHTREFCELEEQMCDMSYDEPNSKSPDRVDALVWAVNELKHSPDEPRISTLDF